VVLLAEDLDRLEEILREKVEQERGGGISFPKKIGVLVYILRKVRWFFEDMRTFIERRDIAHIIHGLSLGISILIAIFAYSINMVLGLAFLLFSLIYHVVSYPESVVHLFNFYGYIILSFANRGSLVSIAEPERTIRVLRSVEYVLGVFVFGLIIILVSPNVLALIFEIVSAITTSFAAVSHYYLSMAKSCWDNPLRRISEKDVFSWEFLVFLGLFAGSLANLYPLVPQGFASVFGWFIVFLSYLFLSAVMAIPSLQAAVYITTRWRGLATRKMFNELERIL